MNKTLPIDLSEERLLKMASQMVDNRNLTGALRMLNKNAQTNGNSEASYMLYAEIYDDMNLYEKSINAWFNFLDCATETPLNDAYEGLAVDFMNLGNDTMASYYYGKLLNVCYDIPDCGKDQIFESLMPVETPHLRFAYPPELCDYTKEIAEGIELMRINDYENAVKSFDMVHEKSDKYLTARNYIAMCKIIMNKSEEAEEECNHLLKRYPNNIQALTMLAAVKTEQKKYNESRQLALKLLSIPVTATDEIYKIATVCCENQMHEEAYSLFLKLQSELGYDSTVLYFLAVSAYNSGKISESLTAFEKLLTIYPNAVTARYYYDLIKEQVQAQENPEHNEQSVQTEQNEQKQSFSYFYRLPEKQKIDSIKILSVACALPKAEARRLCQTVDLSQIILWAFDEGDTREEGELQYLAVSCAAKVRYDDILRSILLNSFLSDGLKVYTLNELALRNEENSFGVVICNTYKRAETHKLRLGKTKRSKFMQAYAHLFSHFAIIEERYGNKIACATEDIYSALESNGVLSLAADEKSLTAAIYLYSDINDVGINGKNVYSVFDADKNTTAMILGYTE